MRRPFVIVLLGTLLAAALLAAQHPPSFTVIVESAYTRSNASRTAPPTASVFEGESYPIVARSADSQWVQLAIAGVNTPNWILAGYGTVDGSLAQVPVAGGNNAPDSAPASGNLAPDATGSTSPPSASEPPQSPAVLTVTEGSAYVRSTPSFTGQRIASLLVGDQVPVTGVTTDGTWFRVMLAGFSQPGWVPAGAGTLDGEADIVPSPTTAGSAAPSGLYAPPVTSSGPVVSTTIGLNSNPVAFHIPLSIRDIYARGQRNGQRDRVFVKIGDCQSAGNGFLRAFGYNTYTPDLGEYAYLQSVIDLYFWEQPVFGVENSFTYVGPAARDGFNAIAVNDPTWADPNFCNPGESPLRCEFRLTQPAIALVMLGSADIHAMDVATFEHGLQQIVGEAVNRGIIPILSTFPGHPHRPQDSAAFNQVVFNVGNRYGVPVADLYAVLNDIDNGGLTEDGFHLNWPVEDDLAGQFTPSYLSWSGVTVRNLVTLQALHAVREVLR